MKKFVAIVCVLMLAGMILSCGKKTADSSDKLTRNAPDWVNKGSGAFPGAQGAVIYGVGIATKDPNVAMQRQTSDSRARADIAKVLDTYVGSLMKDFMQSHKDFTKPENSGSVEFVSSVTKSVTDQTLVGSKVVDHWMDPEGNLYALGTLAFDDVVNAIKAKISDELKNKQGVFLESKANEAMAELNKELDKKKENP